MRLLLLILACLLIAAPAGAVDQITEDNSNVSVTDAGAVGVVEIAVDGEKVQITDGVNEILFGSDTAVETYTFDGAIGATNFIPVPSDTVVMIMETAANSMQGGMTQAEQPGDGLDLDLSIKTFEDGVLTEYVLHNAVAEQVEMKKATVVESTLTGSAVGSLGWSVQTGANTACTTTCTSAAVFGVDSGGTGLLVGPADATAEECVCAGAN